MERTATSMFTKGMKKRKWKMTEDRALVDCMVELYHQGTHNNGKSGFEPGFLNELEKSLTLKLPSAGLKAKPHIESRIKTLKNDWMTVYDMIYGSNTSGFGWDSERNVVTAETEVWTAYLESHPKATPFMTRSLWYFEEFSMIYGKDRATGKDAQGVEDILEEIQAIGETGGGDNEVGSEAHGTSEASVIGTNEGNGRSDNASSKKQKLKGSSAESFTAESIMNAAILLSKEMKEIGKEISKSLGVELTIQEKAEQLFGVLNDIEGLTLSEKFAALRKIPRDPTQMLVFFSIPVEHKLLWVKEFLADASF